MKILMITPYLPYPLFSGGQVRSYNIIRKLAERHEITLFSLIRDNQEKQYLPELEKYCKKILTFKRKKPFQLANILFSAFGFWPFIMHVYNNQKLKEAIKEELEKEAYDILHVETFYLMQNISRTSVPIILFEQNIEHDVYRRIAQYFEPFFLRPFLLFDVVKIKHWEEYFWKKVNALVVMSDSDKKFVNQNAFVSGNGVNTEEFKLIKKQKAEEKRVLFIGNFKWFENRDAVAWIIKDIWPKILLEVRSQRLEASVKLWIVGRNIPSSIKNLTTDPSVNFDEHASEDVREIYKQAAILLAPLRTGGGTSFKVLEAMACGVPVVTTPSVAKAINAEDGEDIFIGESEEELALKTTALFDNEDIYTKITHSARKLVEKKYDWKILVRQIEEIYKSVV